MIGNTLPIGTLSVGGYYGLTGPVFYFEPEVQPGGADWMWSAQLDVDIDLGLGASSP